MTAIDTVRTRMRADLLQAMRDLDSDRARVLRAALGALDNAEAVPSEPRDGAIEAASVGVGSTEAARRELSAADVRAILQVEITERRCAAKEYASAAPEQEARLRAEADLLAAYASDVV